MNLLIYTEKEP